MDQHSPYTSQNSSQTLLSGESKTSLQRVCSLHGKRQCCLANPQLQSYLAAYSAHSTTTSESSTTTGNADDRAPSSSSTVTLSTITPQTQSTSPPPTTPPLEPNIVGLPTAAAAALATAPTSTPLTPPYRRRNSISAATRTPIPILNNHSASKSVGELPTTAAARRRTLDFVVDENAARRDLNLDKPSAGRTNPVVVFPKRKSQFVPRPRPPMPTLPSVSVGKPESQSVRSNLGGGRVVGVVENTSQSSLSLGVVEVPPPVHKPTMPKAVITTAAKTPPVAAMKTTTPEPDANPPVHKKPQPQPLPTPTNHVHLSRKTYSAPTSFFQKFFSRRKEEISDIKGTFVIDPDLVLPRGLFRAFDDSLIGITGRGGMGGRYHWDSEAGLESDADQPGRRHGRSLVLKRSQSFSGGEISDGQFQYQHQHQYQYHKRRSNAYSSTSNGEGEKKNLKLEVENGGIDVDVHLVSSSPASALPQRFNKVVGKQPKRRTTIDLALIPVPGRRSNYPLVARIYAPNPRPPFHLTARTYVPSTPTSTTPPAPPPPPEPTTTPPPPHPQRPTTPPHPPSLSVVSLQSSSPTRRPSTLRKRSAPPTTPSAPYLPFTPPPAPVPPTPPTLPTPSAVLGSSPDSSNLSLKIPRTFHGPITIHVTVGNLDKHIWLSDPVRVGSVVLREGRFARGLFVGGGFVEEGGSGSGGGEFEGGAEGDGEREGEGGEEVKGKKCAWCEQGGSGGAGTVEERKDEGVEGMKEEQKEGAILIVKPEMKAGDEDTGRKENANGNIGEGGDSPTTPDDDHVNCPNTLTPTFLNRRPPTPPPSKAQKIKRKPVRHSYDASMANGSPNTNGATTSTPTRRSTDGDIPSSNTNTNPNNNTATPTTFPRPSFLDIDPDILSGKTTPTSLTTNGHPIGWKVTKHNVNGRVRVVSEHRPTASSPLRRSSVPAPPSPTSPIPPVPTQVQLRSPSPVVLPSSPSPFASQRQNQNQNRVQGDQSASTVKDLEDEDEDAGDGNTTPGMRRLSIERKTFTTERGWSGSPTVIAANTSTTTEEASSGTTSDENAIVVNGSAPPKRSGTPTRVTPAASAAAAAVTAGTGIAKSRCTCMTNVASTATSTTVASTHTNTKRRGEWLGDRIDVSIGKGKVRIQFEDEVEEEVKERKRWRWFGRA